MIIYSYDDRMMTAPSALPRLYQADQCAQAIRCATQRESALPGSTDSRSVAYHRTAGVERYGVLLMELYEQPRIR
jgi:hypothetical protein